MRALWAGLAAVLLAPGGTPATPASAAEKATAPPAVRVAVDPRVELVSVIFRLAGHPEYSRGRIDSYIRDVEKLD